MPASVSVVIPAYNEEQMVAEVIGEVAQVLTDAGIEHEVLVVDDASTDHTARRVQQTSARLLRQTSNRGYGAALKTGIVAAQHETICIVDADGSYPVERIPSLLEQLETADMVVGARTGSSVCIPLVRRPAKWVLNRLANFVTHSKIPDLNSGMRVFRRAAVMQYFNILPDQFSFTTTITMAMHCDSYAVAYVPIDYKRRGGRSKIVPWDAASFTVLILRTAMLFKPLRVFLPCAILFVLYACIKAFWDLFITGDRNISMTAAMAGISSLQLVLIGMLGEAIAIRLRHISGTSYVAVHRARGPHALDRSDERGGDGRELRAESREPDVQSDEVVEAFSGVDGDRR